MNPDEFKQVVLALEGHWHRDEPAPEAYTVYWNELGPFPLVEVEAAIALLARSGERRLPLAGQIRQALMKLRLDPPSWAEAIAQMRGALKAMREYKEPEECLDGGDCRGVGWLIEEEEYTTKQNVWCGCSASEAIRQRKRAQREEGADYEPCSLGKCDGSGLVEAEVPHKHWVSRRCSCLPKLRPELNVHPTVHGFARLVGWGAVEKMLNGDGMLEAQMRNKYEQHVRDEVDTLALIGLEAGTLARVERANQDPPKLPRGDVSDMRPIGETIRELLPAKQ